MAASWLTWRSTSTTGQHATAWSLVGEADSMRPLLLKPSPPCVRQLCQPAALCGLQHAHTVPAHTVQHPHRATPTPCQPTPCNTHTVPAHTVPASSPPCAPSHPSASLPCAVAPVGLLCCGGCGTSHLPVCRPIPRRPCERLDL